MIRTKDLIAERIRAGLTQRDAAKICECSVNTYGKKENGKASFTLDEVVKLCNALHIDDREKRAYIFLS